MPPGPELLPEEDPCLQSVAVKMDDDAFATKIKTRGGPTYWPPNYFLNIRWESMKARGAASASFDPKVGVVSTNPPRRNMRTASLVVWSYVFLNSAMQYDVLLGGASWMRFSVRSYRGYPWSLWWPGLRRTHIVPSRRARRPSFCARRLRSRWWISPPLYRR